MEQVVHRHGVDIARPTGFGNPHPSHVTRGGLTPAVHGVLQLDMLEVEVHLIEHPGREALCRAIQTLLRD